jgi:hypothetical protein
MTLCCYLFESIVVSAGMQQLPQKMWRHLNRPQKLTTWRGDWHLFAVFEFELLNERIALFVHLYM